MNKKTKHILLVALGIISVALIIALVPYTYKFHMTKLSSDPSDWGSFGSYLGGVIGAVFASLSFVGLLVTVINQKQELKDNTKAQELQRFEDTFYSLLSMHNTSLSELKARYENNNHFLQNLNTVLDPKNSPKEALEEAQNEILNDIELSQYFRILYQVLKFVCKSNTHNQNRQFSLCYVSSKETLTDDEKMYASLVRSFVPVPFLPVLAINCIPSYSGLNNLALFHALIERYEFLEHLRADKLPDNLRTWAILDGYSYSFGKNTYTEEKCKDIVQHFQSQYDEHLTEGSYLHTYCWNNPY
ncbi:TPA: hypothetical protein NG238_004394 [Vibrio parahaemolyticus]|nr:hypothetical protein [Vibrio parahaemolyticus]HCE3000228.1 hypothetical protein [Vibrio parahaemolyticus]